MPAKKTSKKSKSSTSKVHKKSTKKGVSKISFSAQTDEPLKFDTVCKSCSTNNASAGVIYGLGFIGALVYYISTATGFWIGVWGVIKAILWPAFLVFELMKFLGM